MIDLDNLQSKCERTVDFAAEQLRNLVEAHPDHFPMYTQNGKWLHDGEAWTNWCEGFLGGQLWLVYQATGDEYFREKAEHYSRLLEHRKTDRNVHDLGFLFFSTWKRWYDITGEEDKNAVVVEAGQTLAKRFKEKGEYLRSFVSDESLFIDIMMNVPIIFYAAQETDGRRAVGDGLPPLPDHPPLPGAGRRQHLARGHLRPRDGRVSPPDHPPGLARRLLLGARAWLVALRLRHRVRPDRGRPLPSRPARTTPGSTWKTRPTTASRPTTGWKRSRRTRTRARPPAAIAASGLIQLSQLVGDPTLGKQYHDYALRIVDTLTEPEFVAIEDEGWEGVLKQGMYHERLGLGVNESVMWGDYFFLEAVCKVLGAE